jgi:beta-mannosidase
MNRITRELLPRIVDRLDPGRAYLPSSPYLAPAVVARGGDQRWAPEQHLWGPRDYFRAPYYSENRAAFASEMGYHGCPNLGSIQRFLPPEDVWPWQGNRNWQVHATDPVPGVSHMDYRVQLMADQIGETFGRVPEQPLPFVRASQVVQAEAKKYFIELFRSRKWRTGGLLWWNVMDCWPQFSDAVVDYYFTRKLAYTYIRRAQRPLCLCIGDPEDWSVPLFVCNDLPEPCQGTYTVTDADSDAVVAEGDLDAPANTTQRVARIRVSRGEQRLLLIRWKAGTESGVNHALVGTPPFDLDRYEAWLPLIAALDNGFDPERMGR